ncbi:neuroligin-4, Y-linked-like [Harmonia axyridis]|uniref:neuroligin-4, Y-linked-like n=1 Tax=Harmonia axyridis TaxID=115357 RepID=UPI001E2756B0|nr:neuroligin-4, Y-linked-like [Harmonia axyridis]
MAPDFPLSVFASVLLVSVLVVQKDVAIAEPAGDTRVPLTSRTVRTKYGDVSGVIVTLDSKYLEPVEVFRGIPYASPPLGRLRFMPPVTGALWSGVKVADKFGPVCPQRLPDIANETLALKRMPRGRLQHLKRLLPYLQDQSEDCLYLNIYAPAQGRSLVLLKYQGFRIPAI